MKEIGFDNFSFRVIERLKNVDKDQVLERIKYWKLRVILAKMYQTRVIPTELTRKEILNQISNAGPML